MCISMFNPSRPCCNPLEYVGYIHTNNASALTSTVYPNGKPPGWRTFPHRLTGAYVSSLPQYTENWSRLKMIFGGTLHLIDYVFVDFTPAEWPKYKKYVEDGGRLVLQFNSNFATSSQTTIVEYNHGEFTGTSVELAQAFCEFVGMGEVGFHRLNDDFDWGASFSSYYPSGTPSAWDVQGPIEMNTSAGMPLLDNVDNVWNAAVCGITGGDEWISKIPDSFEIVGGREEPVTRNTAIISSIGKGYVIVDGGYANSQYGTYFGNYPLAYRANAQYYLNMFNKTRLM